MTNNVATIEDEKDIKESRAHAEIMASDLGYDLEELIKSEGKCVELYEAGRDGMLKSSKGMAVAAYAQRCAGRDRLPWCHATVEPILICVAEGSALPEVCVTFMGNIGLMRKIARYPVVEQRRLIDQGSVDVAVVQEDGKIDKRKIALDKLTGGAEAVALAGQVFGNGKVNTIQEQERTIEARRTAMPPVKRTYVAGIPIVDKKRGGLVMNGAEFLSKKDLINFLGQL